VDFDQATSASEDPHEMVLALNDALDRLALESPQKAEVVKLRYFAGMQHAETARALGISEITVRRHWKYARAWLYTELNPDRIGSAGAGENRGRSPG
jgi:RNA polymerase sigma factor (sigma-70 family)